MPELPDIEMFRRLVERNCIGLEVSNIDVVDAACLVGETPASMTRVLKRLDVPHVYEEFPDDHSSVDYRMDVSLPVLAKALAG